MGSHYSVELSQALVVGEDELKKLADLRSERIGQLEVWADCADDVSRTFKNVNELLAFENVRGKEIRRLHLSARSDDFEKRARIDFSGSRWPGIVLDFVGRDDVVSRLRTGVFDLVGGTLPWYAWLHRVDYGFVAILACFLTWFGSLTAVAFKWIPVDGSKEQNPSGSALAQLMVFGWFGVLLATGILLNRFRNSVFPRAVFLIGQGKSRFQHLERIQWGIVIAFIVSISAGLVTLVLQAIRV